MDPRCSLAPGLSCICRDTSGKRKRQWDVALPIPGLGELVAVLSAKTFTFQPAPPDSFWISQGILDIPGWFSQPPWPGISQCTRARCSCWGHPLRNTNIPSSPRAWERQSDGKRGKPDPETGREELGGRFPSAGLWAAAPSCWKIPTPNLCFPETPTANAKVQMPQMGYF